MDHRFIFVCLFASTCAQSDSGEKPGTCPSASLGTNCFCSPGYDGCNGDYSCPGIQKCFDQGCTCGEMCVYPVEADIYTYRPGHSDFVCFLPKEGERSPNCSGYFPRWWYNWRTKQCEQFIYGGCRGNENNFETIQECERQCKPSDIPDDNEDQE
ncbi:eppin-like [Crassostrea angulata]|uniref:eppin-like n=1 Tax=Magallana angulata TaxID=2784310 RepID=UPI0022B16AF0|nr:eppin-like [Crassostrea angulata]